MSVFADELMKLRRRFGDTYTVSGTLITSSTVKTTDGTLIKAAELIDCYNDAINSYLSYLVVTQKKENWSQYAPGYIVTLTNKTVTAGKISLEGLTPIPFAVIDIMKYAATQTPADLFIESKPQEFFADKVGLIKARAVSNRYLLASDGTNWCAFIIPAAITAIDIIFIKRHTDLTSSITTEFDNQFSQPALKAILLFAEMEIKRAISQDVKDSPEARLGTMLQADLASQRNN